MFNRSSPCTAATAGTEGEGVVFGAVGAVLRGNDAAGVCGRAAVVAAAWLLPIDSEGERLGRLGTLISFAASVANDAVPEFCCDVLGSEERLGNDGADSAGIDDALVGVLGSVGNASDG